VLKNTYLGLIIAGFCAALAPPVAAEGSADPNAAPAENANVDFAADRLEYNKETNIVTASGDVRMTRAGYKLRAGNIVWNRTTGEVSAGGQVSVTNPAGDIAYGDSIALTDTLKDGAVENMLVVMADGGRLAADHGKGKDGAYDLNRATYSPCAVIDDANCPRRPDWLITAKRVSYDPKSKHVRYHDARIEVFGVPLIPIPYFWHTTSDEPATGLLTPQFEYTSNNGLELRLPLHIHLSQRRDLTLTPFFFSAASPALLADYRALYKAGAISVTLFGTRNDYIPIAYANGTSRVGFRGYLDVTGRFQLSPEWNIHGSVRLASDRTVLSNYELSYDDRLRNNLTLERIGPTSYFSLAGWGVETLRPLERQGLTPIALPEIDFRKRFDERLLGGKIDLQLNSLAIARTAGQNTQRAFAGAEWNLRKLTSLGQEIILTAYGRGDLYHSNNNTLTTTLSYRGQNGWQTRAIGALAAEVRWPLIGSLFGGTQRLTPRLQIVASPPTANLSIPNEDARAIELDDSNLFSLNRFPGYDRWEDGTRITYGADWALDRPGLSIQANIGQSYRFTSSPTIFPTGTGLASQVSDFVGRTTVKFHNIISLTHRYRLDKNNLAIRRNEVDATLGGTKTYAVISYLKLNRRISNAIEDLQDHEEVRVGGRLQVSKYWSLYGSTTVDLTTKRLDPLSTTDGYSPVRHRIGIAYDTDCLTLDLSWRRDFRTTVGAQTGSSFQFRIAFRNLGR
jgi:LPS-assembly protein